MKKIQLFLAILLSNFVYAQQGQTVFEQLASVNSEWNYQEDVNQKLKSTPAKNFTEQQLVQFHLEQTEKLLRSRAISFLSTALQKQRKKLLDILNSYWNAGLFPINDKHLKRQPYFIDNQNTYCAVGYLMQQTGADEIAKSIKRTQNYNYLKDIHHPKLLKWVETTGLTIDELALVQPTYGGENSPVLLEMHYNNTGVDVNEYIEIRQGFYNYFNTILFYDQNNVLYKTLPISAMQNFGKILYYTFPSTENFADEGKIELKNSSNSINVISTIIYNSTSVSVNTIWVAPFGIPSNKVFNIGENESSSASNSLSFCGTYPDFGNPGSWNLVSQAASPGVISDCVYFPGVVPVTLSKLDYTIKNKNVLLEWQTENEINSSHFEIERSADGIKFEKIKSIAASGTSTTAKQYDFVDKNPLYINHYRLKQVDLNGTNTYSKILYVKVNEASPIKVIENPVNNNLRLGYNSSVIKIKTIVIYDIMGRKVKSFAGQINYQNLDVANLKNGKYLLQMLNENGQFYNLQFLKAQ